MLEVIISLKLFMFPVELCHLTAYAYKNSSQRVSLKLQQSKIPPNYTGGNERYLNINVPMETALQYLFSPLLKHLDIPLYCHISASVSAFLMILMQSY